MEFAFTRASRENVNIVSSGENVGLFSGSVSPRAQLDAHVHLKDSYAYIEIRTHAHTKATSENYC